MTRIKKEEERITFAKTKDGSKFLNDGVTSFIFRFEDRRKEPQLNLAWFRRFDEVEDHVKRYKLMNTCMYEYMHLCMK